MKANYAFFVLLCVTVLFVSMAVAATEVTTADKPKEAGGNIEAELAKGACLHGCCNRHFYGACKICCASAEEAMAAAAIPRGGISVHGGGYAAAGEAKEKEAKP